MNPYDLSHVPDAALERELPEAIAQERGRTIRVLALIAEWQARGLYLEHGCSSMSGYCVGRLHMSEDEAYKRIRVAKAGRDFPAVFSAIADGRLHMTAALLLAPHLSAENVGALIEAATHKTKEEIELLLAHSFPRRDLPEKIQPLAASAPTQAAERAASDIPDAQGVSATLVAPERVTPAPLQPPSPPARVMPLSPARFGVQFTMSQAAHDDLKAVQALLAHQIPNRNVAEVFERALKLLRAHLEKRKFGATDRPRRVRKPTKAGSRHVPAHVRNAVWERDGGRCTFVSKDGKRCDERGRLEFEHVKEFARGGEATIANMKLLCRAHNQHAADRTYGAKFMEEKRKARSALVASGTVQA
jgi:hypothetical protein